MLADDIKMIADDVHIAMGSDVRKNWEIILDTVYRHRKKIPLLLKAGMGFAILDQINRGLDSAEEMNGLRIMAWNGVVFNCILLWARQDFKEPPRQLAARMTEITFPLYDV